MSITASTRTIESETLQEGRGGIGRGSEGKKSKKSGSFLDKFTSLGGLKTPGRPRRTVSDFHITLDEPHRHFQPGEFVKGCVCVTVEKEFKLTHLVVNLKGNVELFNGPTGGGVHTKKEKGPHVLDTLDEETSKLCFDEQVLCGDGGLKPGVYQFQFVMLLPGKGLPSSLNFEKGKIEYKIMATITRPSAVGATLTCVKNFSVMENIDVARIERPAPKTVSLEKKVKKDAPKDPTSTLAATQPANPSIISLYRPPSPPLPPSPMLRPVKVKTPKVRKRQATISLQQGGCLRGESLTVNIKVQHVKPIKSLCGVIVTLYRHSSFDRLPLTSSGKPKDKGKGKKGAISSSTVTSFRKEISQKMLPLIVDPQTLTWTGTAKIRVPEDSFPTITSVPLGIVSFRYFVEVVVDLGGKVSQREELFVPVNNQPILPQMVPTPDSSSVEPSLLSAAIIETDRIRREKNVKSCRFEVIIGTVDSSNGRGHRIRTVDLGSAEQEAQPVTEISLEPSSQEPQHIPVEDIPAPEMVPAPATPDLAPSYTDHVFPIPELEPLSEKERLRQLEASVMASEPPVASFSSAVPSAPPFEDSYMYQLNPELYAPSAPPLETGENGEVLEPTEDKRELERRRLLEAESVPPAVPLLPVVSEPSAPTLGVESPLYEIYVLPLHVASGASMDEEEQIEGQEGDSELPVYSR